MTTNAIDWNREELGHIWPNFLWCWCRRTNTNVRDWFRALWSEHGIGPVPDISGVPNDSGWIAHNAWRNPSCSIREAVNHFPSCFTALNFSISFLPTFAKDEIAKVGHPPGDNGK